MRFGGSGSVEGMHKPIPMKVECRSAGESSGGRADWSVWRGGALLSETPWFRKNLISRADYEEEGINVLYRRPGLA